MIIEEDNYLMHYGILRRSGRYPWGSGGDVQTRSQSFFDHVATARKEGLTDAQIAKGFGMTTTELRATNSIAKNARKQADIALAQRLKNKGLSNVAIGKRMGVPESTVRAMLKPGEDMKADQLHAMASMLKEEVDGGGYIQIGSGVENTLGVSKERLGTAVAMLKSEGYVVKNVQIQQQGTQNKTTIKVLAPPGTEYKHIAANMDKVRLIGRYTDDDGATFSHILPPISVSSKRLDITYAEQGGSSADGVIFVRPGVKDLSLGGAHYAQVRIAVDGTHYIKGMAMYKEDLPHGVDLVFNTNKSNTGTKTDALKKMSDDPNNPFGSVIRQLTEVGHDGQKRVTSAMNLVNEEGDWDKWSKNFSTQFLSKQKPDLVQRQLDLTFAQKKADLDEIMSLTNPAVRRKLLEGFADSADASSVHLKAASFPRTRSQVMLPMNSMKEHEIYAPNFRNGERVVLVRHPHGGKFEIPELTVNNNNPTAKRLLDKAADAIGIHSKVAERLSGADFDGDTVLVIPQGRGKTKIDTEPALAGLKNFDPKRDYPSYEGMQRMTTAGTGKEMGQISNLITDMTIKGATSSELARAVRHSMVVIDAEKHGLNYKQSALDNGIASLKEKYQGGKRGGASTLISLAKSSTRVDEMKLRAERDGGPIDPKTGKLVYVKTGEKYVNRNGETVPKKSTHKRLEITGDAHSLSSGTKVEEIYASHSNRMKAMADEARYAMVHSPPIKQQPSAKQHYKAEVDSLNLKLDLAYRNKPLERQAQVIADRMVKARLDANPDMDAKELKKIKGLALESARARMHAGKQNIEITDSEWAAIQAGAISNTKLKQILDNADLDRVKQLATPKAVTLMTSIKKQRAQAMLAAGHTQAEVADALGVSLTTLKNELKKG